MWHPVPLFGLEQTARDLQPLLKPRMERLGSLGEPPLALAHFPSGMKVSMQDTATVKKLLPFNQSEVRDV